MGQEVSGAPAAGKVEAAGLDFGATNSAIAIGGMLEKLPRPILSSDAVTFVTADNACDIKPLLDEFGTNPTPARIGMAYLAKQ